MTLFFSDSSLVSSVGPWIPVLDAILKSTILLAFAAGLSFLFRRASAATRHVIWTLGLTGALALPVLTMALPKWQLNLITVESVESTSRGSGTRDQEPAAGGIGVTSQRELNNTSARIDSASTPLERQPDARSETVGGVEKTGRTLPAVSWQTLVLAIWAAGFAAILGRLLIGLIAVQWMSRRTERVSSASWLPLARELAAEIGVRSSLTFLRSPRATMPMAWGILKPSILMPADADGWPVERLRIVLLHELAHVKRRDCLTHALAQIACGVYWFNPLAWFAVRRVRAERERACDDLVLAAGTRGSDYAAQLLEVARVMRAGRFPALLTGATLAMAHRSQLEGRLIAILDPRVPRSGLSRVRTAGATALVGCALLPLASLQPWAYAAVPEPVAEPQQLQSPQTIQNPQVPKRPQGIQIPQAQLSQEQQPRIPGGAETRVDALANSTAQDAVQSVLQGTVQGVLQGVVQGVTASVVPAVAEALGEGRQAKADPRTVAALTSALKDADAEVREAAMHALIQLRDPSIYEPLVQALKDSSADIRERAAQGLGQLRDARAIEPLTTMLKDANPSVREQAVFALGQLRSRESVEPLTQALKDDNPSVREQAAFALGQIRDPRAVDGLLQALKDANPSVREQAVFALGQLRDRRAVPALTAAMTDTNEDVREQAVFALGQLRDPSAVDSLIGALRDAKADIRQNAVFALGQIRDPRAVPALIAALKDADAEVRQNAAFALSQIRDRSAVEALVIAMKDSNAEVRGQAAFALGQLRDSRAIDALTAALKDSSSEVRQQAAFALGQIR